MRNGEIEGGLSHQQLLRQETEEERVALDCKHKFSGWSMGLQTSLILCHMRPANGKIKRFWWSNAGCLLIGSLSRAQGESTKKDYCLDWERLLTSSSGGRPSRRRNLHSLKCANFKHSSRNWRTFKVLIIVSVAFTAFTEETKRHSYGMKWLPGSWTFEYRAECEWW